MSAVLARRLSAHEKVHGKNENRNFCDVTFLIWSVNEDGLSYE